MKRFNFEYGNDEFDDDHDDYEEEGKNETPLDSQLVALQMDQNILLEQEINEKILADSINLCSSALMWRFYSIEKKLKLIKQTYNSLIKILES